MSATGPRGIIHVHSRYSHDGRDTLEQLRDVSQARGLSFVGLTDHAEDFDPTIFERYRSHCAEASSTDLQLIAGLEFRFAGFPGLHLLALGLTRWIAPTTPAEFVAQTRGAAGFTVVAHPIVSSYQVPPEVRAGIDAVEVWNAAYNTRYLPDPKAIDLLREMRERRSEIVGVAGLDQHDSGNDRETRVRLLAPAADPLAELRAGHFQNIGRTMQFDPRLEWSAGRLALLRARRAAFDLLERAQDRTVRTVRRWRRGR
jgi:PHP domain